MKTLFALVCLVGLLISPTLGGDGRVSNRSLDRMGLRGIQPLSDAQGTSIRGTSIATTFSYAHVTGGQTYTIVSQPVGSHFSISSTIAVGSGGFAGGFAIAIAH